MIISACLIGEDSLLMQCGNILLARNHQIKLVISPVKTIQEWATEHHVPWVASIGALVSHQNDEVDFIFSIVNSFILPVNILKLARVHAINYHDSILPKYAGLNSTSWAIINNETEHGITWHLMNERIDEGDIITQTTFPIYPNDTALILNLRCYEHAISSFADMINAIETGCLAVKKQYLNERTYYALSHHLPCFGFIDWKNFSAKTVERLSRALMLGHYHNHIGSLKLLLKDNYLIVSQAKLTNQYVKNEEIPGTILAIEKDALIVATLSKPIKITGFVSKTGEAVVLPEWVKKYGLHVGDTLPSLGQNDEESFKKYLHLALRGERYWVHKIKKIVEHNAFPWQSLKKKASFECLLPSISLNNLFPNRDIKDKKIILLTAILIYLYRLNEHERVAVSLVHPDYDTLHAQGAHLYSSFLPFLFDKGRASGLSLQDAIDSVAHALIELNKYPVFLSDIAARHPLLEGSCIDCGIVINLTGEKKDYPCHENTILYFNLTNHHSEIQVLHRMDLTYHGRELSEIMSNCTQHLVNILIKLIDHPHMSAEQLCFLTQLERHKLLTLWGRGKSRYLPNQSLPMLFDMQVAKNPEKTAIYMGNQTTSYAQLAALAEKVRAFLSFKQIPKHTLVGIYLNRGIEMLAVILGILKADCAYVPLDTKYPLLKIEQIVEDANLSYLLLEDNALGVFADFFNQQTQAIELFHMHEVFAARQAFLVQMEEGVTVDGKLAYIMFTSGTTGRPKGVVVTQSNIINYCKWFTETTNFDEHGIIDFSSSIAFDLSIPCTIAPLLVGGSIAIASDAQKTNPRRYLTHLKKHRVTHAELTPGYLEMLLNHPLDVQGLVDLKFLLLGADVVPTNDVMKWLSLCPSHQVVNEYGPTETTVSATSYFVNKEALVNEASVPIGRPAFNTTCYVLDKYKNLCPAGVKGELYIGGAQVTKGYLNRDNESCEKFIRINLTHPHEIIYKTGDIVCWLPDGNLQFFGRNDHQVKIHGYRVELPSIESVLVKMPGIHQAIVVVMTGRQKEHYLRAYIVTDKKPKSSNEIRTFLASYLPSYMIPREFCVIKAIPLKENEKIDFGVLEKQGYQLLGFEAKDAIGNLNPAEKIIKKIWEKVFHMTLATIHEDFFELGGDSLMALQIIFEMKDHYHMDLSLQLLFEYPTVAGLAEKIGAILGARTLPDVRMKPRSPLVKLATGREETPVFLIHPVGGSVFWYKQLATYLQGKYTIYGIQDVSLEEVNIRFKTLEEMASYYLEEIKKVYSGNHYYLGGASFGATVAFEMAHQLIASNQSLGFLGLFDGWAHYPASLLKENTLDWLSLSENSHQSLTPGVKDTLTQLEQYRKTLLANYKLTKLKANATLFKATELWPSFTAIDDRFNGWSPYITGELIIYEIPGNHETMFFEPHVRVLAKQLDNSQHLHKQ